LVAAPGHSDRRVRLSSSGGLPLNAPPVLTIHSLGKTYRSGLRGCTATVRALVDVHLEISAGEIVGVAGESGAGKTTLLLCAAGLLEPDEGSIRRPGANSQAMAAYCSDVLHAKAFDCDLSLIDNVDRVRGDVTAAFALVAMVKRARKRGRALLLAARDASVMQHVADRILRLDSGRLQSTNASRHPTLVVRVAEGSLR